MKPATKAIHSGGEPDPLTGAVMPPIYMTSTFAQSAPASHQGYEYTRAGNPNFDKLETLLASLENGSHATIFSSGLGALTALITTMKPGASVCGINGVYGGTYRLFNQVFKPFGIQYKTLNPTSQEELEQQLSGDWLLFETPTNPLLEVIDIAAAIQAAKKKGMKTIVDNTFATPYFQNPLDLGADIVWHSTTKYLGGHSDVIGGVMIVNDQQIKKELDVKRMSIGVNPSPFDAWLTMRGVKTLAVRMEQHQKNALAVARCFENHPKVKNVYYPGLENHPGHEIAKKQMRGYSGIVSAEFEWDLEETKERISGFQLFTLAESLGGVESLVNHPALMTHASIPPEEREKMGISDGLIRFSVGIEDTEDLLEDLDRRLK